MPQQLLDSNLRAKWNTKVVCGLLLHGGPADGWPHYFELATESW